MLITKLKTSTSFRAIAKVGIIFGIYLNISTRKPTHSTLLCWVKKIGIYQLNSAKEKANENETMEMWQKVGALLNDCEERLDKQFANDLRSLCMVEIEKNIDSNNRYTRNEQGELGHYCGHCKEFHLVSKRSLIVLLIEAITINFKEFT